MWERGRKEVGSREVGEKGGISRKRGWWSEGEGVEQGVWLRRE